MTRLEAILEQMQQPETTLAESVKLYAEAASLMDIVTVRWKRPRCSWMRSTRSGPPGRMPHIKEEVSWITRSSIKSILPGQIRHWKRPARLFARGI